MAAALPAARRALPPWVRLRAATADDIPAVATIYRHYVDHSFSTYAYPGEWMTPASLVDKWKACLARGLPWFVAVVDDAVLAGAETLPRVPIPADLPSPPGPRADARDAAPPLAQLPPALPPRAVVGPTGLIGYCYVADFRPRAGWSITVEDSIYLAPGWGGHGLGDALLTATLDACRALGPSHVRNVIAAISADPADATIGAASVALHARHGFTLMGRLQGPGVKYGRTLDNVFMQLQL